MISRMRLLLAGMVLLLGAAQAAEVRVAVASNFSAPMRRIAADFERDTGHNAVLTFGSTGAFAAQIRNGAPFDLLLSADDQTPTRLEQDGLAVAGTRFTYAVGQLVLWSAQPGLIDAQGEVLRSGGDGRIAIADPRLAPYGAAAIETLTRLGLLPSLRSRFVQGENISQTYQFISTGNAQMGFVALSQVLVDGRIQSGSSWVVPARLHAPIRQDAVLLMAGRTNPAAAALAAYLRSDKALAVIRSYGYQI
jgi:molybdate transport system substrate-binding protein